MSIVNNFDVYTDNVYKWVNKLFDDNPEVARFVEENVAVYSKQFEDWLTQTIIPQASQLIKSVSLSILSFIKVLWNFIIGFIISIYLLASKETLAAQAKKILYAFCSIDTTNKILRETRYANKTFINFFIGKIIDSTIIGVLCFIGTSIMGIPYAALVSVIIGVTNIIPFFGPIIGAVPTALLILIVDISNPVNCLYYVIFVLILQQLDGNVIGPLILGESTGLSSFWIIFAIIFFGGLWDVFGMFVGVPLMAVIYSAIRRIVTKKLKAKELPEDTGQYMNVGEIDSNKTLIPHLDETGNVISGEIEDPMPSKKARLKRKKNKAIISIAHKTEEIKEALAEKKAEVFSKIENSDTENEAKEENREDSDGN
jgi:predicted PurR-regulated permease PerM